MSIEGIVSLGCEYDITLFGRRLQGETLKNFSYGLRSTHLRLPRMSERFIQSCRLIELLGRGDLYHALDFYMPLSQIEKAIATIHDLIFLKRMEKVVDHERLARWVPKFANRCRRIITISNSVKKDIVERLQIDPAKIDVIYWGVETALFRPESDKDNLQARLRSILGFNRPYFLAVSCYTGRKNTPLLLDAYSELAKNNPFHDLVLVWDAPDEIREKYNKSHTVNRIHFVGRQSDQSLRDLYCGATALVFPSLEEGFGLPILEAMSCGTPVVTSNLSSMPEVGGDAAIYIDPYDVNSLLSKLECFENQHLTKEMLRDRSLKHAEKFTWKKCAQETLDVYAKCLED